MQTVRAQRSRLISITVHRKYLFQWRVDLVFCAQKNLSEGILWNTWLLGWDRSAVTLAACIPTQDSRKLLISYSTYFIY